jgi:hypothetical protein
MFFNCLVLFCFSVSREGEEEVPSRTTTIRAETPPPTRRTARHERRHHQRTRTTPEREAKDVARTRNHEVETEGGGVQSRTERVEGPLEAAKTSKSRPSERLACQVLHVIFLRPSTFGFLMICTCCRTH